MADGSSKLAYTNKRFTLWISSIYFFLNWWQNLSCPLASDVAFIIISPQLSTAEHRPPLERTTLPGPPLYSSSAHWRSYECRRNTGSEVVLRYAYRGVVSTPGLVCSRTRLLQRPSVLSRCSHLYDMPFSSRCFPSPSNRNTLLDLGIEFVNSCSTVALTTTTQTRQS